MIGLLCGIVGLALACPCDRLLTVNDDVKDAVLGSFHHRRVQLRVPGRVDDVGARLGHVVGQVAPAFLTVGTVTTGFGFPGVVQVLPHDQRVERRRPQHAGQERELGVRSTKGLWCEKFGIRSSATL